MVSFVNVINCQAPDFNNFGTSILPASGRSGCSRFALHRLHPLGAFGSRVFGALIGHTAAWAADSVFLILRVPISGMAAHIQCLEQPLRWAQVVEFVQTDRLPELRRSVEQEAQMQAFNAALKTEWATTVDYILHRQFGLQATATGPDGKLQVGRETIAAAGTCTALALNDFPYYYESGIMHYVLWKIGGDVTSDDMATARQTLLANGGACVCFINPPHLRSIPGIAHGHLLLNVDVMSVVAVSASSAKD